MNLRELIAEGARAVATQLAQFGTAPNFRPWIAPNIIRYIQQEFPVTPWRSARALVTRVFQSLRAAKESLGSDMIYKKDVPLFEKPEGSPYRGIGRGCFEARFRYRVPEPDGGLSGWKTDFVNWDRGLTLQQAIDLAKQGVAAKLPFSTTDPRTIDAEHVPNIVVEIDQIYRRC